MLDDLLTNYERIADHCSNIAVAMIEVSEDRFDTHEYLNHIKNGESPSFEKRYERYRGRYTFEPGRCTGAEKIIIAGLSPVKWAGTCGTSQVSACLFGGSYDLYC